MFVKLQTIILVFCYITAMTEGLTIRELSAEDDGEAPTTDSAVTESSYRKSVAKIKETPYRVPEHLQFVPKGFIYEDADDVIHVIDPPRQFEELKKIMRRQQERQLQNLRPIALREQRPKQKIVRTKHKSEPDLQRKPPLAEHDLQTQESQHLPLEILASVRKTENYLRKYKPKLPAVRQRLKTQKIQTVIWEQQQEKQQYQQGQQQRLQAVKEQTDNRRRYIKKRFRRDAEYKRLEGELLLNHISELIKNASSYLQQTKNYDDYPDTDFIESTTRQGEVLFETTKNPLSALNQDMVVKILENSVKATNVIMQQIKTQTNLTTISERCDYLKVTYPNHIQNLQNQIKCMQNFIKDINHTQQNNEYKKQQQQQQQLGSVQQITKQYDGERLKYRKTKDLEHRPFIVAELAEDYIDDTEPAPVNSSLIYDDVMTTIRNMLQTQNLQSIEDVATRISTTWEDAFNENAFTYDKSPEPVDFHNLHEYLTSLEAIVTNLPKFNHKSLNLQEIEGGTTSKYYFINPQGTIYSLPQPFQKDVTTPASTTRFHQFTDLPVVREYLRNGSLQPHPSQVIEIL